MTKITEMINLKAAVVGAAALTTLLALLPKVAQAQSILDWDWTPDPTEYEFQLDLNSVDDDGILGDKSANHSGAIQNFKVLDTLPDPIEILVDISSLDLEVEECNSSTCGLTLFNNVKSDIESNFGFGGGSGTIADATIYRYKFDYTSSSISFFAPSAFDFDDISISDISFPNMGIDNLVTKLDGLEILTNQGFSFPMVLGDDNFVFDIYNPNVISTVPEPSNLVSLLALGIFGTRVLTKRQVKTRKDLNHPG